MGKIEGIPRRIHKRLGVIPMTAMLILLVIITFRVATVDTQIVEAASNDEITLFLAGDTIINQPWSHLQEPEFLRLVDEIRGADVAIVNLETPIHEYQGYAQAEFGGTHLAAPPSIAFELAWAGIDMVSHANNHTFDYGSIGVLETLSNTDMAGLVLAGAGKDLQQARAPRFFKHSKGIVGLVSAAATFSTHNAASRTYPDMHGRPGLNPLRKLGGTFSISVTITPATASFLEKLSRSVGNLGRRFTQQRFHLMGMDFTVGGEHDVNFFWGGRFDDKEVAANLAAIREARAKADVVVFSIHAHGHAQGPALTRLAHQMIDAGADVFVAHGPHTLLGIEMYKGKPIFYSPGAFVFQIEQVERYPSETYDKLGLPEDATLEELKQAIRESFKSGYAAQREVWESFVAILSINLKDGKLTKLQLLPLDLGFGKLPPIRGRPSYADKILGKYIIDQTIQKSRKYGTLIEYVEKENRGRVNIP